MTGSPVQRGSRHPGQGRPDRASVRRVAAVNDAGLDVPVAGGIAIARRAGDESARLVAEGYVEGALAQGGRAAWATYRDDLSTAVPGLLGAGYKAATGQTLYDVLVELSADGPFISVSRDASGDLMVHLVTGRNSISATSTQPTFPQWGDPRFSFAFGLEMTYRIDLPPSRASSLPPDSSTCTSPTRSSTHTTFRRMS